MPKVFPGSSSFRRTHVQNTANKQTTEDQMKNKVVGGTDRQRKRERGIDG